MTYTPLKAADCAVLFADLQEVIVQRQMTQEARRLAAAAAGLAKLARLYDLPIVVSTVAQRGDLIPELASALGQAHPIERTTTDAFTHPVTREAISRTRRKVLLVAGVATEVVVQHSALSAGGHGMEAQVVLDACGGLSPRTEDAALRRLVQAGVVTTSVASVIGQLVGDFSSPRATEARAILAELIAG